MIMLFVLRYVLVSKQQNLIIERNVQIKFINKPFIDEKLVKFQILNVVKDHFSKNNLMESDIRKIYNRLMDLGFIEKLMVKRDFPDRLKIIVKPYNIIACKLEMDMYGIDFMTYPITSDGKLLSKNIMCNKIRITNSKNSNILNKEQVDNLMIPEVPAFLSTLSLYPKFQKIITGIEITDALTFNLKFYDDINELTVKLPEDYKAGLDKLLEMDEMKGILSKNIEVLDMSVLDMITVKLRN